MHFYALEDQRMREVTRHIFQAGGEPDPADRARREAEAFQHAGDKRLKIIVTDEPGMGGTNYRYEILAPEASSNPAASIGAHPDAQTVILFQNGPIGEAGVNGLTLESLLAIAADHLAGFQSGSHPSPHNKVALDHVESALRALQNRTRDRVARGVEGTRKL
jgi:hypothetical protein